MFTMSHFYSAGTAHDVQRRVALEDAGYGFEYQPLDAEQYERIDERKRVDGIERGVAMKRLGNIEKWNWVELSSGNCDVVGAALIIQR